MADGVRACLGASGAVRRGRPGRPWALRTVGWNRRLSTDGHGRDALAGLSACSVFEDKTLLLLRAEYRTGLSSLVVATSEDGLTGRKIDTVRGLHPLADSFEEHWGVEDARITKIGNEYYVVYVGYSAGGPPVLLATTRDFTHWERRGVLMPPEDKDAALFPTTFGGRWALIHRPAPSAPGLGAHMWLSFSSDLWHWGDSRVLLPARRGGWWDANKVGLGPPPLLTSEGWLICYHAVRTTVSGSIYRLGLALLDRDDPAKMLARGNEWVLGPHEPYEREGDVPNVVFPCGWVLRDDSDTLHLYYGRPTRLSVSSRPAWPLSSATSSSTPARQSRRAGRSWAPWARCNPSRHGHDLKAHNSGAGVTSWRNTSSSASFEADERASRTIQPVRRKTIRYSSHTITSPRSWPPSSHPAGIPAGQLRMPRWGTPPAVKSLLDRRDLTW